MIPSHSRWQSSSSILPPPPPNCEDFSFFSVVSALKRNRNGDYLYRTHRSPSYQCPTCNRSFTSLILFHDHKQSHVQRRVSQLGVFGLPVPNSIAPNPGVWWGSRRMQERRAEGYTVERELSFLKYLNISSGQSVQFNWRGNPFRHLLPCSYSISDRYAVKPAYWKGMLNSYLWKDAFRHYRTANMVTTSKKSKTQLYCGLIGGEVGGNDIFACRACPCHPSFDSQRAFEMHNRRDHPLQVNQGGEVTPYQCDFCLETANYVGSVGISPSQQIVRGNEEPRNPFALIPLNPTSRPPKYTINMSHRVRVCSETRFLSSSSSPHTSTLPSCTLPFRHGKMESDANNELEVISASNNELVSPVSHSTILPNIKKETIEENGDSQPEEVDYNSMEEWTVVAKKRRLYHDGVEVLRCTPVLHPTLEYLRCGVCNHIVPNPKKRAKDALTAFGQLKEHIQLSHKAKTSVRRRHQPSQKVAELPQSAPNPGGTTSVGNVMLECPICGRRMKTNMKRHLFSHKNDEARTEIWERGTSNMTLRRTYTPKERENKATSQPKRKRVVEKSRQIQLGFSCTI